MEIGIDMQVLAKLESELTALRATNALLRATLQDIIALSPDEYGQSGYLLQRAQAMAQAALAESDAK